ncbi:MAG: 4-hydroxy-3-methylbut-2-enyl diphosphate reductase [Chloroflexota bacterium]|nr:4-hydroxy-3-methylbut-2-enyl diphosphate reductase [Chloroflexota bacterium]
MATVSAAAGTDTGTKKDRRIIVADTLGYCWGVRRALDIIEEAANPESKVAPIGDIIHNPQVVERLRARGVEGQQDLDQAEREGFKRVAITAHGYGPQLTEDARVRGLEMIDTTCPLVTKVQRLAQKLVKQGYFLVVYGDDYHPEVRGVLNWANTSKSCAAKKIEQLPWNAKRGETGEGKVSPPRKVALVSQTTKNIDELMEFAGRLQEMVVPLGGEFRFANTICEPTTERQEALKRLVDQADVILAIGGKKSSNTARLADVGNARGVPSYHIERPEEIQPEWLEPAGTVGVTAGASTPDDVIEEVVAYLADTYGLTPPEGGIRPVDPDYVPSY